MVIGTGMFIGTRITSERGETLEGDALVPNSPNSIDDWTLGDSPPAGTKVGYTIELFETAKRPDTSGVPGRGPMITRPLWKKIFVIPTPRMSNSQSF